MKNIKKKHCCFAEDYAKINRGDCLNQLGEVCISLSIIIKKSCCLFVAASEISFIPYMCIGSLLD